MDSNQLLKVQDKKSHNVCFSSNRRALNSWLVGLIKCKECGYAVMIDIQIKKNSGKSYRYLIDYGWMTHTACVSRGYKIRIGNIEDMVYNAMCERIKSLEIARKQKETPDKEAESIKADILRLDDEIRSLMDKMAGADDVVFGYIQQRIKELHSKKSELERKMQVKARKRKAIDTKPLEEPLKNWDSLIVQEKHDVAAEIIDVIYISHHSDKEIEIVFGI